jgi:hypothetical protein
MKVMLEEIARKQAEAEEALAEQERRCAEAQPLPAPTDGTGAVEAAPAAAASECLKHR